MKRISCAAKPAAFSCPTTLFASMGAALLVAAALCGPALADPAAAGPAAPSGTPAKAGGELEEIVVTAEKRESTVQATPISMTALTGGDLAQAEHRERRGHGRQRSPAYRCVPRVPVKPSTRCAVCRPAAVRRRRSASISMRPRSRRTRYPSMGARSSIPTCST